MTVYFYDSDGSDCEIELREACVSEIQDSQLLWIDLLRRDTEALQSAAELLQLTPTAFDLLVRGGQSKQLDSFDSHFQLSVPVAPGSSGNSHRVDYLVAKSWLLEPDSKVSQ